MSNTTTPSDAPSTADAAKGAAQQTAGTAADDARAVAGTATDQARGVAEQARAQAGSVVGEARAQADKVMSTATSELSSQLEQRLGQASTTARDTASQLRAMAEGRPEEAGRTGDLARQAGDQLERLADRVDELGFRGVTEEVTDFARRRPVAFLVGAAATGFLVGRLVRAGKEVSGDGERSGGQQAGGQRSASLAEVGDQSMIDLTSTAALPADSSSTTAPSPGTAQPAVIVPATGAPVPGEPGLPGEAR